MLFVWITRLLLCFAAVYAARKGDEPERLVAIIVVAMLPFDIANHLLFGDPTWFEVNPGHFVIDIWALLTLTWVAVRANRGWTLWISAMQLIAVMAHFGKLLEIDEARLSYWFMEQMPWVVEICVLIIGTWAHVARQRRIGQYAPWRPDRTSAN